MRVAVSEQVSRKRSMAVWSAQFKQLLSFDLWLSSPGAKPPVDSTKI
jgi:hypothetical protein